MTAARTKTATLTALLLMLIGLGGIVWLLLLQPETTHRALSSDRPTANEAAHPRDVVVARSTPRPAVAPADPAPAPPPVVDTGREPTGPADEPAADDDPVRMLRVTGRVVVADRFGEPQPMAGVEIDSELSGVLAVSGPDGRFAFRVMEDATDDLTLRRTDVIAPEPIEFDLPDDGDRLDLGDCWVRPLISFELHVFDPDLQPVTDARFSLWGDPLDMERVPGQPPHVYGLLASTGDDGYTRIGVSHPRWRPVEVQLPAIGSGPVRVGVRLGDVGLHRFTVVDGRGLGELPPVSGATAFTWAAPSESAAGRFVDPRPLGVSDANGELVLEDDPGLRAVIFRLGAIASKVIELDTAPGTWVICDAHDDPQALLGAGRRRDPESRHFVVMKTLGAVAGEFTGSADEFLRRDITLSVRYGGGNSYRALPFDEWVTIEPGNRFRVDGLQPGEYLLGEWGDVPGRSFDLVVRAGETADVGLLEPPVAAGSLQVLVQDDAGQPVAGMPLYAARSLEIRGDSPAGSPIARTDEQGRATITPPARTTGGTICACDPARPALGVGDANWQVPIMGPVVIRVRPWATVSCRVVTAAGDPVADSWVWVYARASADGHVESLFGAPTDGGGWFRPLRLPPGTEFCMVYYDRDSDQRSMEAVRSARWLRVPDGSGRHRMDCVVDVPPVISGMIRFADGTPAPGVEVTLRSADTRGRATTAADGSFSLSGRGHWLYVHRGDRRDVELAWRLPDDRARPLELVLPAASGDVIVTLADESGAAVAVGGTLRAERVNDLPGLGSREGLHAVFETFAVGEGASHRLIVPAGSWRLRWTAADGSPPAVSDSPVVHVLPRRTTRATITCRRAGAALLVDTEGASDDHHYRLRLISGDEVIETSGSGSHFASRMVALPRPGTWRYEFERIDDHGGLPLQLLAAGRFDADAVYTSVTIRIGEGDGVNEDDRD